MTIPVKQPDIWRNKKTDDPYLRVSDAMDASNNNNWNEMVIYRNIQGEWFVRDKKEFLEKFVKQE